MAPLPLGFPSLSHPFPALFVSPASFCRCSRRFTCFFFLPPYVCLSSLRSVCSLAWFPPWPLRPLSTRLFFPPEAAAARAARVSFDWGPFWPLPVRPALPSLPLRLVVGPTAGPLVACNIAMSLGEYTTHTHRGPGCFSRRVESSFWWLSLWFMIWSLPGKPIAAVADFLAFLKSSVFPPGVSVRSFRQVFSLAVLPLLALSLVAFGGSLVVPYAWSLLVWAVLFFLALVSCSFFLSWSFSVSS